MQIAATYVPFIRIVINIITTRRKFTAPEGDPKQKEEVHKNKIHSEIPAIKGQKAESLQKRDTACSVDTRRGMLGWLVSNEKTSLFNPNPKHG